MNTVKYEDLATSEGAETAKEKRMRWAKEEANALKGVKSKTNDDLELISPRPSSVMLGTRTRICKKRNFSAKDEVEMKMAKAMQSITTALWDGIKHEESKEDYIKHCLWKDLVAMGLEKPLLYDAFILLAGNFNMIPHFLAVQKNRDLIF